MSLEFYGHPFSSYCQKALIALYENSTPFEWRLLEPGNADITEAFAALWPIRRMPLLRDGNRTVVEASIIIEHLGLHHPGPVKLIPEAPAPALEARTMDRFFDNYIHTPLQKLVFDSLRSEADRDSFGRTEARSMLDTA